MIPTTLKCYEERVSGYAAAWPGFPSEVHVIMALIEEGYTHEEAAAMACNGDTVKQAISDYIDDVELNKATLNPDGSVALPSNILMLEIPEEPVDPEECEETEDCEEL